MAVCDICPRNCRVDRDKGEMGFCRETARVFLARAALHYWEEPCISGKEGSGAVFFSGCNMRCVFCQNGQVASGSVGSEVTIPRLAEIFLKLQEQGANNINLVTPSHYVIQICRALELAKERLSIPVVYNSSGYEKPETLRLLDGLVDIYLPDFKYWSGELSEKYSRALDYREWAQAALAEMVRQVGKPVFEENRQQPLMKRGVIVRHLILPGHTRDSKEVIRYLHETYGDQIFISIMNQYTPMPGIEARYPELGRRITRREYQRVVDYAIELGVENGFIQEGETAKESFIPDFAHSPLP